MIKYTITIKAFFFFLKYIYIQTITLLFTLFLQLCLRWQQSQGPPADPGGFYHPQPALC